jgi:hypothetical protein
MKTTNIHIYRSYKNMKKIVNITKDHKEAREGLEK